MKKLLTICAVEMKIRCLVLATVLLSFPLTANATITNYSGNEVGFETAISGLSTTLINFENLTQDDIISDQYRWNVLDTFWALL